MNCGVIQSDHTLFNKINALNLNWLDVKNIGVLIDFKSILTDSKWHSKSQFHLHNYKCLKIFGKFDIQYAMSETTKIKKEEHNLYIKNNIKYLKHLTNAVLYLCKQKMPLRGHD
ncbi:hypothetical protein A3Q56_00520 [Intoshia linei]|uniref:Uncharacterized protein n=1 Tax=Intoshia linei TaxID=1819745 RepID=A0A177BDQ6_9BILA|nr:hypothetical protein A3Q56_00520 [Intoshia linei]